VGLERRHTDQRVDRGDRRVRAGSELHPAAEEISEPVHGGGAVGAEALFVQAPGEAPPGVERRLHADRETEHRRPFDHVEARHLEMLDAVAAGPEVTPLPGVERLIDALPCPHHLLDGGVADRVDPHLQAREMTVVEVLRELVVAEVAPRVRAPVHEPAAPSSWTDYVKGWVRQQELPGEFAILTQRSSAEGTVGNHRMEIINL
jgi:hypothetical protein